MKRCRLLAPLLFTLLLTPACDSAFEQTARPPQGRHDADATSPGRQFSADVSVPLLESVTPAALFEHVNGRARRLAQAGYSPPQTSMPAALAHLDYEQYRSIRFRPEAALWHDETPFEVQLFHPGFLYTTPVRLHVVDDQAIIPVPFDTRLFRYDDTAAPVAEVVSPDLGYAGFRIHYPLNDAAIRDEVMAFLGASYFRLLGRGHVHGLSSRGLAVDIALDRGEEFPAFTEFWLVRPEPDATTLTFYALLDSPSVTGAYRFDLAPGAPTTLGVDARLFARHDIDKLGVAPMSSMFLHDQNQRPRFDDFRPQVHDSDGLLVHTADDEWIWRPLSNTPGVQVTAVHDDTPRGFGLVQRDREFGNYLDLEANYHRRPSEWVALDLDEGDWGAGGVELLAFHTVSEFNDNIAAYWVPDQPFRAGDERHYRYRLIMFDSRLDVQTVAQVARTRVGWDALPGEIDPPPRSQRQFIVDFSGGEGEALLSEATAPVEAVVEISDGQISDLSVQPLPAARGWRAAFRLVPAGTRPADMRLHLEMAGQRISETWTYVWYPGGVE